MSSRPEIPTRVTGAHQAHGEERERSTSSAPDARAGAPRTAAHRTAASRSEVPEACEASEAAGTSEAPRASAVCEPYLDGLYTYSLSVLCDRDAATSAVGAVLAVAGRRGSRVPGEGERRAWLYALARWACLRGLAENRRGHHRRDKAGRDGGDRRRAAPAAGTPAREPSPEERERRRAELATLAWPEAAGTTPEQREALELSVRHGLTAEEVATVLGIGPAAAQDLLASAACEVERTRAALGAAESGHCPGVILLTGQDDRWVLSEALRAELVRHVDDCPRCRRTAERAVPGRWPGTSVAPERLPVLEAPRPAVYAAARAPRGRRGGTVPRFDRRGFPLAPRDREARRRRMRGRAVVTAVVATVVAAPALAMWAAGRSAPPAAEEGFGSPGERTATAAGTGPEESGAAGDRGYANTANAVPGNGATAAAGGPDVSVEVTGAAADGSGTGAATGALRVSAVGAGDTTHVTLTAPSGPGASPVRWRMTARAPWLYLSRASGVLRPGESVTVRVHVDPLREPAGAWRAGVAVAPGGAVIVIRGTGVMPEPARPGPVRPPADPSPAPSQPEPTPPGEADPTSPPTDPSPPSPSPSDPPPSGSAPPPSGPADPSDQAPTEPRPAG
ncbi:RNA polymerase sigma factor [Streptomyces chilikensis]|uniref:ECF-type sigma factor n=1 Tax=Streptomyces chilikensis TaxID=1194079 RepID=A0ABV3EZ11_9ACTN